MSPEPLRAPSLEGARAGAGPAHARVARRPLAVLARWWTLRCAACGEGEVFPTLFRIHDACPACGYRFSREDGYFLGSIYFNYGVTTVVLVAAYLALEAFFGLSVFWQTVIWIAFALTFPFWFHRYARQAFMVFDLYFAPPEPKDYGRGPEAATHPQGAAAPAPADPGGAPPGGPAAGPRAP